MHPLSNVITATVTIYLGPSHDTDPSGPLKYTIAFNDEVQVVHFVPLALLDSLPFIYGLLTRLR